MNEKGRVRPILSYNIQGVGDEDILLEDYNSEGEEEDEENVSFLFILNCLFVCLSDLNIQYYF